jgi:hypothetical protein
MNREFTAKWAAGMAEILSRKGDQTANIERFLEELGLVERGEPCWNQYQ